MIASATAPRFLAPSCPVVSRSVRYTNTRLRSGSAQAMQQLLPLWPKVCGLLSLPGPPGEVRLLDAPYGLVPVGHRQRVPRRAARDRQARAVLQHLPDRDRILAVLAEPRPVLGHAVVQGKLSALGEQVDQQRDERLAGREDPEERVRPAADGTVEDHLTFPHHAELGSPAPGLNQVQRLGQLWPRSSVHRAPHYCAAPRPGTLTPGVPATRGGPRCAAGPIRRARPTLPWRRSASSPSRAWESWPDRHMPPARPR
jgi:hypothetical protein